MTIEAVDRVFLEDVLKRFLRGYERQKKLLSCNTTPPNERNAYFSLSNAIFQAAGRKDVIAATEISFGANRRVDAVFVINKTMYILELKIATARLTTKKKQTFRTAKVTTQKICDQLNAIDPKSPFIRNTRKNNDIGINRVVCAGMTIGNLRFSEALIETSFTDRNALKTYGDAWLSSAEQSISKEFTYLASGLQSAGPKVRINSKDEGQIEAGSVGLIFSRALKV
jgi:hypothetical protein